MPRSGLADRYDMTISAELREQLTTPGRRASLQFPRELREQLERDCGFTDEEVEHLEHCAGIEDDAHTSERLTDSELHAWLQRMDNADGSTGQHWTKDQTASIAAAIGVTFDHVTAEEFCAAMNMMYSDYFPVGVKYGVDRPEFYADLAKAFLFDKDGPAPSEKLAEYYHEVVK